MEGKPLGPRPLGPRLGLGEGSKGFGCTGVGGRGTAPELVWWTGGVDQGPWLQEKVWAGRRGGTAARKKGRVGAWCQRMARCPRP